MSDKLTKLSQAIRLGATFHPQCRGEYWKVDDSYSGTIATCAIGAAAEAVGVNPYELFDLDAELSKRFKLPDSRILQTIVNMNDDQHKTREEIADWLSAQGL